VGHEYRRSWNEGRHSENEIWVVVFIVWLVQTVITFDVYFFHVTNPSEILTGAKPVVTEGKFCLDCC
jgi:hypothetical protein